MKMEELRKMLLAVSKEERKEFFANKEVDDVLTTLSSQLTRELREMIDEEYIDIMADIYYTNRNGLTIEVISFYEPEEDDDKYQLSDWYTRYREWGVNCHINDKQRDIINKYRKEFLFI